MRASGIECAWTVKEYAAQLLDAVHMEMQGGAARSAWSAETWELASLQAARSASAVVMTKDSDFVSLLERFGPPPQVV